MECKFGEKCNRKHYFVVNNENAIRRLDLMRNLPISPICKLTKFRNGDKDYFGMRNGTDIDFFDFNWENKQQNKDVFGSVYKWNLPNPNVKYNFYDNKGQYIYYSGENADKLYQDIGFFNISTLKNYFVANAHQGTVTGMAHFMETILITSSIAG